MDHTKRALRDQNQVFEDLNREGFDIKLKIKTTIKFNPFKQSAKYEWESFDEKAIFLNIKAEDANEEVELTDVQVMFSAKNVPESMWEEQTSSIEATINGKNMTLVSLKPVIPYGIPIFYKGFFRA